MIRVAQNQVHQKNHQPQKLSQVPSMGMEDRHSKKWHISVSKDFKSGTDHLLNLFKHLSSLTIHLTKSIWNKCFQSYRNRCQLFYNAIQLKGSYMIGNTEFKVKNLITMTGYKTDISQYLILNNIQASIVIHLAMLVA